MNEAARTKSIMKTERIMTFELMIKQEARMTGVGAANPRENKA